MNQSKVYQVIDGELVGIELSPLAQRMFFHLVILGKKCTSDGFTDYRNDEQKKMHQLAISVGACELANTVVFGNMVVSPEYFREELVNFLMKYSDYSMSQDELIRLCSNCKTSILLNS